jgi:hypothetical protein
MTPGGRSEADEFIDACIDSVPHLEALLLLWNQTGKAHTAEETARYLYIETSRAAAILQDLERLGLSVSEPGPPAAYRYASGSPDRDRVMVEVDRTYRRELVRVTRMIHSKGSQGARAFARAFRFTKKDERQ